MSFEVIELIPTGATIAASKHAEWQAECIRAGDWGAVVEDDQNRIRSIARANARRFSTLTEDDCEDIVQQTIFNIWNSRANFDPTRGTYKSWSAKICINAFHEYCRKRSHSPRQSATEDSLDELETDAQGSQPLNVNLEEEKAVRNVDIFIIRRNLDNLDEDDKRILKMILLEGKTPSEAATASGCTLGAMRKRIHRARLRFEAAVHPQINDLGKAATADE